MNVSRLTVLLVTSLVAGPGAPVAGGAELPAREDNRWPVLVRQEQPVARRVDAWSAAGPFLFSRPAANLEGETASGFRPFWVQLHSPAGEFRAGHFLYPLFSYSVDENTYRWSLFELVRRWDRRGGAPAPQSIFEERGEFEVFPFWFSRQSGDPEMSYWGLFPLYGTVKNKLGFERLFWAPFPLYVENEQRGAVTTSTPWPIVRITRGAAHGWGIWPLFNYVERPGVSRFETYLWPLGYNVTRHPFADDPPGTPPRREIGALPFYARSSGPGYISEHFGWPFFGYTDRTLPARYHERRYFWPFLVQGRGEQRYVNRWAPFYTHSVGKGLEKRWYLWPVLRQAAWTDREVERHRTQLLYFVYWHERQQRAGGGGSVAELTHYWPLLSHWDNGAGQRQWQFPSVLDVLFPGNEKIRHTWSPFFSLVRHDQRAPGETRTSALWDAITFERLADRRQSEFHLGPLLSVQRAEESRRISLARGLVGLEREAGSGWRLFWLDFRRPSASLTPASPRP